MEDSRFFKKSPPDGAFFRKTTKDVMPVFRKGPKLSQTKISYVRPMVK